jgi:two-component system, chemotaxis family, sensor kinase CheA
LDMAKYRGVFIEESVEHLAVISSALLALEKEPLQADAIDLIFRMAHSIKGMAASLDYERIAAAAHRLEDRMQVIRAAGRIAPGNELAELFAHLEGLESMVGTVRDTGAEPVADDAPKKKHPSI